jgi:hypothetical protein
LSFTNYFCFFITLSLTKIATAFNYFNGREFLAMSHTPDQDDPLPSRRIGPGDDLVLAQNAGNWALAGASGHPFVRSVGTD